MKFQQTFGAALLAFSVQLTTASAFQPPPSPAAGPATLAATPTNVSGIVKQYNYDRNGNIEGLLLNNNTLVRVPREATGSIENTFRVGSHIRASGYLQPWNTGMRIMIVRTIQDQASGKQLTVPEPGPGAPYSVTGRITQLNYGRAGDVNGFMLNNGVLAAIPPYNSSNPSSLQVGATVSVSGYAHSTVSGRTVVDAQTLAVNGQQLALVMPAPPQGRHGGPDRDRPRRARGGAEPGAPPIAPSSSAAAGNPSAPADATPQQPVPPPPPPASSSR